MSRLPRWLRTHPRGVALIAVLLLAGVYVAVSSREPSEQEVAASLEDNLAERYGVMNDELRKHDPLLAVEVGQMRVARGSVRCRRGRDRSSGGGATWGCSVAVRSPSGNLVETWHVASTKAACWTGVRALTTFEDGHIFPGDKLRVNGCVGDRPPD